MQKQRRHVGEGSGMAAMGYLSEIPVETSGHILTEIAPISVCS
jgi:hypothetical protein